MIKRIQILFRSSWNWQWFAAQQPLLEKQVKPALASLHHNKSCPSAPPPAELIKTPFRVNALACVVSSSSTVDELEYT
jgi:hypothetical protein